MKKFKEFYSRITNPQTPIDHLDSFLATYENVLTHSFKDPNRSGFDQIKAELIRRGATEQDSNNSTHFECRVDGKFVEMVYLKIDRRTVLT